MLSLIRISFNSHGPQSFILKSKIQSFKNPKLICMTFFTTNLAAKADLNFFMNLHEAVCHFIPLCVIIHLFHC